MTPNKPDYTGNMVDARTAFARHLLALAAEAGVSVEGMLRLPTVENAEAAAAAPVNAAPDTPTLIVPGLLGNSVRTLVAPLLCARERLAVKGYRTEVAWVSGRSGCDRNAHILRDRVLARCDHYGEAVNVIGYSKGCADTMHMLGHYPDTHAAVRALVSLGGVVGGTPLADDVARLTNTLLRYMPLPGEATGDGRAVHDMRTDYRVDWLADHPLPPSIRYAAITAVPDPHNVSRILRASYRRLSVTDSNNDSQVVDHATILPECELLATVNADHWAIALPLAERHPWLRWFGVDRNDFPRGLLLQGIIDWLG